MRVSLIGPGDLEFHYKELLGLTAKQLDSELEKIAKTLVEANSEIELLPDRGVSFEIAKKYKALGGKKVIGAVPKSDKTFGIDHLKEYINTTINGKPLFDEIIDSGDWFKHDLIKGLFGDVVLYLGSSPGADGERHYAVYLYKLMKKFKKGVEVSGKNIHPEIRVSNNYGIIVYTPFVKAGKLPEEDEAYLEKFGISLYYTNNVKELKQVIEHL